ncbi:GGDEF domain-containing protein [Nitriliruptor alkaliphilus]|uniref:GGDEF domain-containing protein n=1 Tax=Nitriliruptor alkaliphilus TaxID=427918 RepID=UPI00069862BE|nr:GGDEF domain-containing protein [Nitriliruptor alkaliphilus]
MRAQDGEADDPAVRYVYHVVLAVPLALTVLAWSVWGVDDTFRRLVSPAIVLVHGALLVALGRGPRAVRAVAPWIVTSLALIVLARLAVWELSPSSRPDSVGLLVATVGLLGVAAALAFLVFGTRRGIQVNLVGYALFALGAAWSASWGMLAETRATGAVVVVAAGHAMLIGVVWVLARNVEKLAAARAHAQLLELQATTDPLTRIANRRRLDDELGRGMAQARRHGQPLSAILVDLDHFKTVNDTFGHDVGDAVLIATVAQLHQVVRSGDLLGRWGGEEFMLLAPQTGHAEACTLAERCRASIAATPVTAGVPGVTASLGVATLEPDEDARALLRRADLALYTAKREGRDRVVGIAGLGEAVSPAEV